MADDSFRYGFFNSLNHDRQYYADDFNSFLEGILSPGVFEGFGDSFKIVAVSSNEVEVGTGKAWYNNIWMHLKEPIYISIDLPEEGQARIDTIYLFVDIPNRTCSIELIKGTPVTGADVPVAPALPDAEFCHKIGSLIMRNGAITDISQPEYVAISGLVDKNINMDEIRDKYMNAFQELGSAALLNEEDIAKPVGDEGRLLNVLGTNVATEALATLIYQTASSAYEGVLNTYSQSVIDGKLDNKANNSDVALKANQTTERVDNNDPIAFSSDKLNNHFFISQEGNAFLTARSDYNTYGGVVHIVGSGIGVVDDLPEGCGVVCQAYNGNGTYREYTNIKCADVVRKTSGSSKAFKKDISDISEDLANDILNLRPVSYKYDAEKIGTTALDDVERYGFIAEEVNNTLFKTTVRGEVKDNPDEYEKDPESGGIIAPRLDYQQFIAPIIKLLQMQQEQINELKNQIEGK